MGVGVAGSLLISGESLRLCVRAISQGFLETLLLVSLFPKCSAALSWSEPVSPPTLNLPSLSSCRGHSFLSPTGISESYHKVIQKPLQAHWLLWAKLWTLQHILMLHIVPESRKKWNAYQLISGTLIIKKWVNVAPTLRWYQLRKYKIAYWKFVRIIKQVR